jgi:hypothetical protein
MPVAQQEIEVNKKPGEPGFLFTKKFTFKGRIAVKRKTG